MDNPIQSNTPGIVAGNKPNSAIAVEQIGGPKAKDRKYKKLLIIL